MNVTAALQTLIGPAQLHHLPICRAGRVTAFDGTTMEAVGLDAVVGGQATVGDSRQAAEIFGFCDGRALLMGLSPLAGIELGAAVWGRAARPMWAWAMRFLAG